MHKYFVSLALVVLSVSAQIVPEVLTNEAIIKMVQSRVPAAKIISSIAAAGVAVDFRLADADLQRLKEAKVSDAVLKAMEDSLKSLRVKADDGDSMAQFNVGLIYRDGRGVPQDYAEAARWFRKAADQGLDGAQVNLGVLYFMGQGVAQDYAEAANWYRKAADQELDGAQLNLGLMHKKGQGVPQDYTEAVALFRGAANSGLPDAQFNLGLMYSEGNGVPVDLAEAVRWFRKAAEQGLVAAQINLGVLYFTGEGIAQDSVQAYMWFDLAVSRATADDQKKFYSDGRNRIAAKMTTQQIASAQRLAREWRRKNSK